MSKNKAFPKSVVQQYNDVRRPHVQYKLCHAPFQNLYFGRDGKITACCYNRNVILGQYPAQNLLEIWTGDIIKAFRQEMTAHDIGTGCDYCADQLMAGNIDGLHAKIYDQYVKTFLRNIYNKVKKIKEKILLNQSTPIRQIIQSEFPRSLEFELSNICNLECAMCFGEFSSLIRKNREGLPPLPMLYDEAFVKQLDPFLPHMQDAKFYGGEPFLIPIYYDIWERMIEINPNITIHITSNGTVLNEKVKRILNKLNVILILSIDSLEKETYEAIRQNASYERVMENLKYFETIAKEKQHILNLAVCPTTLNWKEIPHIVKYCNEKGIYVYFNTVWYPYNLSLRSLSISKLKEIINFYKTFHWSGSTPIENSNMSSFKSYVNQVNKWLENAIAAEKPNEERKKRIAARIEILQRNNLLFNILYRPHSEIKNSTQPIDNQLLKAAALQYASKENFIVSYFDALCEIIYIYSGAANELTLAIHKSNVSTIYENLLTQFTPNEIIEQIIDNDHEHTARFIIQLQQDEMKDPTKVFAKLTGHGTA